MSVLKDIKKSEDVRKLSYSEMQSLAEDVRREIISAADSNGGHLSANLGIVETTIALYHTFDFPKDKLIFDVGHQCYTHKILSGRKDLFGSIRTVGGLSGFPDAKESEYDVFTTGHAGNSLSLGLGLCAARDRLKQDYFVVNVVGDGALVNGLNLEALTSTPDKPSRFIVILNDNGMSISKNRNGFYRLISKSTTKKSYVKSKNAFRKIFGKTFLMRFLRKIAGFIKRIFNKNAIFERFGFKYVGVVDGNNVKEMSKILERIKNVAKDKAVFLHVKTQKGKGLKPAEEKSDLYHGVGKHLDYDYSSAVLGETLKEIAEKDEKIVAITAGMKDGTGLCAFEKAFSDRFFDVGIAEEYAVSLAAGMAKGGLKPVVAVYSTFLQRAYDEILHDVCLQNLPVVFCADRAGFVGEDGKTHQGLFDLSYATHLPNLSVFAPAVNGEFSQILKYALSLDGPSFIRYPKSTENAEGEFLDIKTSPWRIVKDGEDLTVIAVGPRCLKVAVAFAAEYKKSVKVVSARVVKPLDVEFLSTVKTPVITMEENMITGGFGSTVSQYFSDKDIKVKNLGVNDVFVAHSSTDRQLSDSGISVARLTEISDKLLDV